LGEPVFLRRKGEEIPLAHHKSALKRIRQNEVRRDRNRKVRGETRTMAKRVLEAIDTGDAEKAASELRLATIVIAKAASKGVLKKATASRKIGRLSIRVNKIGAEA
jgi:small subunit ribosomal protein S20